MTDERKLPQLVMRLANLASLPALELPAGYHLRHFEPGDELHWEAIVEKSFGWSRDFGRRIASHPYYQPERVLFICDQEKPVATACAWEEPQWEADCGYLHMVGVDPAYGGRGLGYSVSLAALHRMREEGKRHAVLETDDFRLSAIHIYLKLGYVPAYEGSELEERWRQVHDKLNIPFIPRPGVQAATKPGKPDKPNEDALVLNERHRIYGVIDGVSSMTGYCDADGSTGGWIAAQLLARELGADTPQLELREAVLRANSQLMQRMDEVGVDTSEKWKRWGAVFAVVKVHASYFEYVQSGDCMLFARYRDGSIRVMSRNQVAGFDHQSLTALRELKESGTLTEEEISLRMKPIAIGNRNLANMPGGYSVMNGDPALASLMEYGHISLANVQRIYAVSDGMFHFIENDEDPRKWEKFLNELDVQGIKAYMERLVEEEELDPLCEKYPRHKKSDDKSAVIVELARINSSV
ncbi:protein phosphatase 2C-like protein [Paenibacillus taihuensis]|uniref:Protein phosphatase 2C-like protein n=1 Tax=Paenibacillus taihuensis TaxID=1156355 RepID=A0A3D9RZ13_9BACL|nr:GNAT family N-acetyltransferase [Paenibacillus taihuensis]REE85304.1 protein phosphatase 2C-like protein [Paenibacillus taihuensis]